MTELSPLATTMDTKDLYDEKHQLIESRLVKFFILLYFIFLFIFIFIFILFYFIFYFYFLFFFIFLLNYEIVV